MSLDSARRPYAFVTGDIIRIMARPRFSVSETKRCCAELVCALAAIVLGTVALVQMLDLALDRLHGWIG